MREGKGVEGKRNFRKEEEQEKSDILVAGCESVLVPHRPHPPGTGSGEKKNSVCVCVCVLRWGGGVTGKVWLQELTNLHRGVPGQRRDKSLVTALQTRSSADAALGRGAVSRPPEAVLTRHAGESCSGV